MNPYLLSLMIYLVLITPLRLFLRIRIGTKSSYLLRIQAAGLPFYRSRRDEDSSDEHPIDQQEMSQQLQSENLHLLRSLISKPILRLFFRSIQLKRLSVYVHISQPDAMQNALLYEAFRTTAETAGHIVADRFPLRIHLRTDFQGQGSEVLLRCIVSLRLGSLLPAAFMWLWRVFRLEKEPPKEENYAASH